jgi:hypothetical protein
MQRLRFILISVAVATLSACSKSDFETIKRDFQASDLQTISRLANIQLPDSAQIQLGYLLTAKDANIIFKLELPAKELAALRQALSSYQAPAVRYEAKLHSSHPEFSSAKPIVESYDADGVHVLICEPNAERVNVYIEAFSPPYRQEFTDARNLIRGN